MEFKDYFPIYDKLTEEEKKIFAENAELKHIKKGESLNAHGECFGLFLIKSGQFRAHIMSEDGREVTVYRLFERDMCLFTASCMMRSIQFDIFVSAEKDSQAWLIPVDVYKSVMDSSAVVANYTNEIMASRFTEVMWLIEQVMWKSFDKRLAGFLVEESNLEGSSVLKITHEKIASHLGTAREVVSRMLKYFQNEGYVKLSRGEIEITDIDRLIQLDE